MDSLTSFLMDQHGAEMSLDALTDSMLANLPHVPGTFDAAAPIVPFTTDFSKSTGYPTKQEFPQQYKATWDFPIPPEPALEAPLVPFSLAPDTTMDPLFPVPQDPLFSSKPEAATPAAPAPPNKLQHATSSSSSDSKGDHEMSKLQERIQKQKEKNARNQREFRKRAKERASKIEEQVQQLTAKLSETELEKQNLAAKNRVLEAALASAGHMPSEGPASCAVIVPGALTAEEAEQAFAPVVLSVRDGAPLKLSVEQIKRMTWSELSRIWKEYINAIAMRLVTANNSFNGSSEERLKELVAEVSTMMRSIALHNAMLLHQHSIHRMDASPNSLQPQQPPPGFYVTLLGVLGLSKEQKEQILAHRHIKLVSLARLVQERRELQARLQACNEAMANPTEDLFTGAGMGKDFPHLLDVAERLKNNVAQLHRSVCLFMGNTWTKVLTPAQAGTFMVQAFPWAPDMLALANAVALEAGAPTVKDIFVDALSAQSAALQQPGGS
ncbi:hypothetical protein COCOBI_04-2270 [Coccomyxa sp. Obi]|nr:hypothetical protein COCOBI_04-2270 [Coccomyxa sp. Obi]